MAQEAEHGFRLVTSSKYEKVGKRMNERILFPALQIRDDQFLAGVLKSVENRSVRKPEKALTDSEKKNSFLWGLSFKNEYRFDG